MKFKIRLLFLFVVAAVGLLVNSCKKNNQDYIETLIAQNQWQLSSAKVTTYVGSTATSVLTLDTACLVTQIFKFNTDNTCTYTNFDCLPQATKGTWALSQDRLFLNVNMTCKDTIARTDTTTHSKPFLTARIVNLGQYSLILQTGNLETYYSPTQIRVVYQWGFVRVKSQ
ncbi:hypothetical protein [Mucilaginibacter sp. BT774]|uniref:hypothetical protein n=1 Tax=Mucilaginibacter sp. BT774 TaxID=3062276 RepID=UPI00267492DB|nr:hypothetical protein [Mucilaginibacter sp. BT774]MDO3627349.1 hypothetical protein [Mucilaginibacter sp. BT774]